jgi:glycosyltransferase involved in cell wall biosynthesis
VRALAARYAPADVAESQQVNEPTLSSRGVTVVVPAYDEEQEVRGVMERLCALDLGVPLEILVVDDGSKDRTPELLRELEAEYPALRVIHHAQNRGYGAALVTGFANAKHEVVVITDADGTYPEDRIVDLLACIDDGAEMAVGARRGDNVHIPLVRRPAKWMLRKLASFLAGVSIPDLNSGLRAFRRELVMQYRAILPPGFSFTTTITLASLTNGHRVDYVDIDYAQRGGSSKIRPIRDTLGFTQLIIRTVLYFNPLKVFYPVAFVLAVMLVGLLWYDLFIDKNLGDKTVLIFVALLQVMSVGLLADLIDKKSRL